MASINSAGKRSYPGFGVARVERNYREELVFSSDTREVLGYRQAGYFTDLKPHLDQWLADGVITKADHEALQPPR